MSAKVRRKLRIVFASAEVAPFTKTGGLGDVAGSLPKALAAAGCRVAVMTPKYGSIKQEYVDRMEHVCDFYLNMGWRSEYCGLERIVSDGVEFYFIDNEHFFKRDGGLYGYFDDGERFAFFSQAITESLQYLPDFRADVLHCNDWQTALAPVFLREYYQGLPLYDNVRTVFSVHNAKFQGQYGDSVLDTAGLLSAPKAVGQMYCGPKTVNYMQGALIYSDLLSTVSPTYAQELKTPFFGEGLDGIFRQREGALHGIVNGIDVDSLNPATDPAVPSNYSIDDMSGKAACKEALQRELGREVNAERPLVAMVTRLTKQKGLDLVQYGLERLLGRSVQVAVLGTGDRAYEDSLRYFDWKYRGSMRAVIDFDLGLSQRMYAGADMFLMPSLFEPCGLSQLISMRYGTLPIVRETGGLKDTVTPYNRYTGEGTGFSFANFNGEEMCDCVLNACEVFWTDKQAWSSLQRQAMGQDFSWTVAANRYIDLYSTLHPEVISPDRG